MTAALPPPPIELPPEPAAEPWEDAEASEQGGPPLGWVVAACVAVAAVAAATTRGCEQAAGTARTTGTLPGCGEGSPCAAVLLSRFDEVLGIPVSTPALVVYVLTAAASIPAPGLQRWQLRVRRYARQAAGALMLGAAAWFLGLQVWLGAACVWCLIAQAAGIFAAAVLFRHDRHRLHGWAWAVGGLAAAALAGAQLLG